MAIALRNVFPGPFKTFLSFFFTKKTMYQSAVNFHFDRITSLIII